MCKRNLTVHDVREVRTTREVRAMLAHNNKIEKPAIADLRKRGVAIPPDIMARTSWWTPPYYTHTQRWVIE